MHRPKERTEPLERRESSPAQSRCSELGERPSGCAPSDEPEHGTPPIVMRNDAENRVVGPKTEEDIVVDEASEESFPASDPPSFVPR